MRLWCKKEKKNRVENYAADEKHVNGRHSVCCWAERQFACCRLGRSLIKLELSTDKTQTGGVARLFNANWVTQALSGETFPCLASWLVSPSMPLLYDAVETCCTSFFDLMGAQLPSSLNWISSQSMQLLRISTKSLQTNTNTHTRTSYWNTFKKMCTNTHEEGCFLKSSSPLQFNNTRNKQTQATLLWKGFFLYIKPLRVKQHAPPGLYSGVLTTLWCR